VLQAGLACCGVESSSVDLVAGAWGEPKVVVAFGACAISGGPYWDSYSVISGAHELVPVDIQVPGCPPGPEELAAALLQAVELTRK